MSRSGQRLLGRLPPRSGRQISGRRGNRSRGGGCSARWRIRTTPNWGRRGCDGGVSRSARWRARTTLSWGRRRGRARRFSPAADEDDPFERGTPAYYARLQAMLDAPIQGIAPGYGSLSPEGRPALPPWVQERLDEQERAEAARKAAAAKRAADLGAAREPEPRRRLFSPQADQDDAELGAARGQVSTPVTPTPEPREPEPRRPRQFSPLADQDDAELGAARLRRRLQPFSPLADQDDAELGAARLRRRRQPFSPLADQDDAELGAARGLERGPDGRPQLSPEDTAGFNPARWAWDLGIEGAKTGVELGIEGAKTGIDLGVDAGEFAFGLGQDAFEFGLDAPEYALDRAVDLAELVARGGSGLRRAAQRGAETVDEQLDWLSQAMDAVEAFGPTAEIPQRIEELRTDLAQSVSVPFSKEQQFRNSQRMFGGSRDGELSAFVQLLNDPNPLPELRERFRNGGVGFLTAPPDFWNDPGFVRFYDGFTGRRDFLGDENPIRDVLPEALEDPAVFLTEEIADPLTIAELAAMFTPAGWVTLPLKARLAIFFALKALENAATE